MPWRRERLPTPVFWPGEFHGLYSPWGHKESDTTERLSLHFTVVTTGMQKKGGSETLNRDIIQQSMVTECDKGTL